MNSRRLRIKIEVALAAIAAFLCLLTLVVKDWIEVFGIEPDGGDGSAEWLIVGALALVAVVSALTARYEYRRLQTLPSAA